MFNPKKAHLFALSGFLLISSVYSCMHDELEVHLDKMDDHEVDPDSHAGEGRMLDTAYGGIRLSVDYSLLSVTSTELAYIKKLMTAAVNFWYSTLQVPQLSVLKIPEAKKPCAVG
jgi:hypothetical protein